jgi:demethylmenaquinone methyltransferase/2-methoxy-6-polyprenyl-1,4-benzoquinol methylase
VTIPWLAQAYDAYSFKVLPALGGLIAGDAEAYRYLAESIRRFPDQDAFTAMIADVGFERTRYRNLSGGIAVIFSAWRL